jgi:hypothetical protein
MTNWTFLGWYYPHGGEQIGPVSSAEIARLVGCGQLQPAEEVWTIFGDTAVPLPAWVKVGVLG